MKGLLDPPVLAPTRTEADFKTDDPEAGVKCTLQQVRFIRALLSDGTFNRDRAVEYAWPKCPPERRSAKAAKELKRPEVREAMQKVAAEAIDITGDVLKYRVLRRLILAVTFDPFQIIDRTGKLKKGLKLADLGEYRQLIAGIDPRTGRVHFVDRDKSLAALSQYVQIADDRPIVQNNLILLPGKVSVEEWNKG